MKNFILAVLSSVAFISISNAQCDATFNYTHVDCDSLWFVPASTGPQYTYYWNFGDGQSSTDQTPVHVFNADGSYAVILVLSDTIAGCTDVLTVNVNVNCGSSCSLNSAYNVTFSNCQAYFVSTVLNGTPPYTYYWDFGDGGTSTLANPTHTYPNNSWYWNCYTITDANGCDTTICDSIYSSCTTTSCDASFNYTYSGCDSIWFVPNSLGAQYTYYWDFGDGSNGTGMYASHQYSGDGTYPVVLNLTDTVANCTASFTGVVIIDCAANCSVNGAFAYSTDSINCDVQLISTAWGGTAPYTYFWDFGDGQTSTQAHPNHQYQTTNWFSYTCLTITDANGCDTTMCDSVITDCYPQSCDAQYTAVNIDCDSVWFYPVSYGPQYNYSWDFGDGSTSTDASPTHVYSSNGIYITSLVVFDSLSMCYDSYSFTVLIDCGTCDVDGHFTSAVDTNTCQVQFISSAWGGTAPYSYYWTFGDGSTSTQAHPSHQYPTNGLWTPCLTITDANGCDTSFCLTTYVNCNPPACNSNFTATPVTCDSIWFVPDYMSNTALYTWYFDDGGISYDPSTAHQYSSNGVYYVVLEVWDSLTGCYDSSLVPVTINCINNCTIDGAFNWYVDSINCDIQFVSTAWGGTAPYSFYWNFGDGTTSTQAHPSHNYPNYTTFTPCLTITDANGCDTTICDVVYSTCTGNSCNAQFNYTYVACDSVWFIPLSTGNQYDYYWDFGDGSYSTQSMPAHQYAGNGTYTVVLYITDSLAGCYNAYTMQVDVNCGFTPCGVVGTFTSWPDSINCDAHFYSTAWGGTAPYSYYWEFGDGGTSSSPHPTHSYPTQGSWTVCLTITDANGCDTTVCDVAYVLCTPPSCDAMFNYTYAGCDSIWFAPSNVGSGITHYWNFGDGATSTATYPSHQYTANGTYAVVLTVIDSVNMCSDSYTALVTINCGTTCSIAAVTTHVSNPTTCSVSFASSVYGGDDPYSYYWDFGDGNYSLLPHPQHQYAAPGTYATKLTATDPNGCDTTVHMTVIASCTAGLDENEVTEIDIYPNPSKGIFNVDLPADAFLEVYDVSGKLLLITGEISGGQQFPLDLSNLENGAYILRIHIDDELILKRLIKQ